MTSNKKLLMFALAGAALVPAADLGTANATPPKGASVIVGTPLNDDAPVGGSPMPRLRRTDEEQPGMEMPSAWISRDTTGKIGTTGLYFVAATELKGVRANHRIQGALVPFNLTQAADGTISAVADINSPNARFITDNQETNEYRNFNASTIQDIVGPGGEHFAYLEYNVQPNNGDDTIRYAQIFNKDGVRVMNQTEVFAKNNDDASMQQDGSNGISFAGATPDKVNVCGYSGANGNGRDDGWVRCGVVTFASPTSASFAKAFDVSVCPREERSRGTVRLTPDKKALIASWTEGNTQPQRDGVWLAAIDLTKTVIGGGTGKGADQQQTIAWKQQVDGRVDQDGIRTYSMRMKMEQITDQAGAPTSQFLIQYGHLRGSNNTNGKGGTYYRSMVGVVQADVTGMSYIVQPKDTAGPRQAMDGIDGTHLGQTFGMFGTKGSAVPGVAFLAGSHFGGGTKSEIRVVTFDQASASFKNAGSLSGAPHDRHLYSNYLGNNPGNQGRNHSHGQIIDNPFFGQNGSKATQLLVYATTAKEEQFLLSPEKKLAAWLTVTPIQAEAETPLPPPEPTPNPNPTPGDDDGGDDTGGSAGQSLGGCSTGGSTGLATFLLIGLAAFLRRRRS